MRKLLLGSVAVIGAVLTLGGAAQAQSLTNDTTADGQSTPAPGSLTVRLNGRFNWYAGAFSATGDKAAGNKLSGYSFGDYARLFPGFDGVAANGLKYGASLEIRSDTGGAPGGGANGGIGGANRARGNIYLQHEWGYFGTDKLGTIRVGSTDNPSSLYITGTAENFNDGGFDGDVGAFLTGVSGIDWPFPEDSGTNTVNKIVYLSPQFAGFDFGASIEPNTGGNSLTNGNCPVAQVGCDALSSTTSFAEAARPRNLYDVLLRYRGTFGPVGVAVTGSYIGSGKTTYNGPITALTPGYQSISEYDFGAALTFGGFQVGGNYLGGTVDAGGWNLNPSGTKKGYAFAGGGSYTTGPVIVGVQYVNYVIPGMVANTEQHEWGVAAGGTYTLAPGVSIFLSYLFGEKHNSSYDYVAQAPAAGVGHTRAQVLALGTQFSW